MIYMSGMWYTNNTINTTATIINIIITIIVITRCQASNVYGRVVSTLVHVRGVVEEALVIRSKPTTTIITVLSTLCLIIA